MAIFDIVTFPDARLKNVSEPIQYFDASLQQLVADLEETMRASPGGVGIALPQIGIAKRIIIVDISSRNKHKNHGCMILVNPEITEWDGMSLGREGCLSVPDYTGNVIRAKKIHLEAHDPAGNPLQYDCEGYEARAVQHELDHLDGFLFIDRVVSRRNDLFQRT